MTTQPITNAVYGKRAAGRKRKPSAPPRRPNQPRSTVAGAVGARAIDDLYRSLGFKRPEQRRKRGPK